MCTISFIGDQWSKTYPAEHPWVAPYVQPTVITSFGPEVTEADIQALRDEIASLKKLLRAAKIYDEETGQADCEQDEKVALIRRLCELCDVDLEDIL